ncbi:MAG: hypothetical protein IJ229_13360 [Clostridia bacterium]|nr:hypothetical protein [Clostridia bacterium]
MLFGRRKPGFSKEVELTEEEISDSFSDMNDPAMQRDSNPKYEKAEMAKRAEAVMAGETGAAAAATDEAAPAEEKQDIFDYLASLPDDGETPAGFEETEEVPEEPVEEKQPEEVLADYIRARSSQAFLTAKSDLAKEEEHLDELLKALSENPNCSDIRTVKGKKDEYFYSDEVMANNYAMIAMLVAEKDIPATVTQMVRFNCKTYPSPTPLYYFMRSPYFMTQEQLDAAVTQIQANPDSQDIKTTVAFNNVVYLYSEDIMSARYAKALADGQEAGEADF